MQESRHFHCLITPAGVISTPGGCAQVSASGRNLRQASGARYRCLICYRLMVYCLERVQNLLEGKKTLSTPYKRPFLDCRKLRSLALTCAHPPWVLITPAGVIKQLNGRNSCANRAVRLAPTQRHHSAFRAHLGSGLAPLAPTFGLFFTVNRPPPSRQKLPWLPRLFSHTFFKPNSAYDSKSKGVG